MNSETEIHFSEMTYSEFLQHVETIAKTVESETWMPDYIVGIGRGGLVPGTYLSHRMNLPLLSIDYSSKVHEFSDGLLMNIAECCASGEKYLFVDDINDSGKTIARFRSAMVQNGATPQNYKFAVLIGNIASREMTEYTSQTIDRRVDKRWFIFPWGAVASRAAHERDACEDPERLGISIYSAVQSFHGL